MSAPTTFPRTLIDSGAFDRRLLSAGQTLTCIEGRGHGFPTHSVTTDEALGLLAERGISAGVARRVANAAGADVIEKRNVVADLNWYRSPHSLSERVSVSTNAGLIMAVEAARNALRASNCDSSEIGTVVFVTSTILSMPSPEVDLMEALSISSSALRVPVWGRGCAGGPAGLALAARLAAADPERAVLLVVAESCSAHGRSDDHSMLSLLITLLYGDGASAMVLRAQTDSNQAAGSTRRPSFVGSLSRLVPQTTALGGWDIDDGGFRYRHHADISEIAASEVPLAVYDGALSLGLESLVGSGRLWAALHPTNAAVMEQQAETLGMTDEALQINLDVFAHHGNTSAPSVLIALDRILAAAPPNTPVLALATGPGYSIEQVWVRS
jgi:alkylresorcinol/alkylpyrone synthase